MLSRTILESVSHVVLFQPTSPLRTSEQVDSAIRLAVETGESVISVALIDEPHPYKVKMIENGVIRSFIAVADSELPRQELPKAYRLTGAIYVASRETIMNRYSLLSERPLPFLMDHYANIDSEIDLKWLQFLIAENLVSLEK